MSVDVLANLPAEFLDVRYVGSMVPGHRPGLGLRRGANCQRYAYAVLGSFGLSIPDHRSCELWVDDGALMTVEEPAPLDLVLFGKTSDPWGAHVGVHIGGSAVLHLCEEGGVPVVWDFADFAARKRYGTRIGFKRVRPR